ncbi:MAG: hypothetical protein FJ095_08585 [Deltaproteobacteria bacterium]|nr:hypothetical protein [Deltaproteobacteria bacterium]
MRLKLALVTLLAISTTGCLVVDGRANRPYYGPRRTYYAPARPAPAPARPAPAPARPYR